MLKKTILTLTALLLLCATLISCANGLVKDPNHSSTTTNEDPNGDNTTSTTQKNEDDPNHSEKDPPKQEVVPITHPKSAPESIPDAIRTLNTFSEINSRDYCPKNYLADITAYVEGYTGTYNDGSRLHPVLSTMRIKNAFLLFKDLSIITESGSAFYISDNSLNINVFVSGENTLSSASSVTLNNNSGMNEQTMDHNKCSTLRFMGVSGKNDDILSLVSTSDRSSIGGRIVVNNCTLDISGGKLTPYASICIEQGGKVIFPDGTVISLSKDLGYGVYFVCDYENRKCRVYSSNDGDVSVSLTYSTGKNLSLSGKSGAVVLDMPAPGGVLAMDNDFCSFTFSYNGAPITPSKKDGKYFYYLPGGSDLSSIDLDLFLGDGYSAMVAGKRYYESGKITINLPKNGETSVTFIYPNGARHIKMLCFVTTSANVLELSIDESLGSISAMHRDSSHETYCYGSLSYLSSDADESFTSHFSIKGRGNATWEDEKKGYSLKLYEDSGYENKNKIDISGMGKTSSWVLIASHRDRTLIRTGLALTLARSLGLRYAVDYVYVDLYMNGQCLGLYMLVEKIQDGKDQIDIELATDDNLAGGYLLEFDNYSDTPQITLKNSRQKVTVYEPNNLSSYSAIEKLLNEADVAIRDPRGYNKNTRKYWHDYIDLDSFAILWMVREFTMDYDADVNFRFYYDPSDGKFHAGPAWDFDNSMARTGNLYKEAESALLENAPRNGNCWLHLLMNFDEFTDKIVSLYNENIHLFTPENENSIYATALSLREELSMSIELNFTVWKKQLTYNNWNMPKVPTYEGHFEILTDFILRRCEFWKHYIPDLK